MATPKKPQDHKPKVDTIDGVSTVTIQGITVSVPQDVLDDFELLDDMSQLQEGNGTKLSSVARRLFGDNFKTVMDALRGDNGRVSIEATTKFIQAVLEAVAPNS